MAANPWQLTLVTNRKNFNIFTHFYTNFNIFFSKNSCKIYTNFSILVNISWKFKNKGHFPEQISEIQ